MRHLIRRRFRLGLPLALQLAEPALDGEGSGLVVARVEHVVAVERPSFEGFAAF
jgi:hypothetical protein